VRQRDGLALSRFELTSFFGHRTLCCKDWAQCRRLRESWRPCSKQSHSSACRRLPRCRRLQPCLSATAA
jgi:hypothetical protein